MAKNCFIYETLNDVKSMNVEKTKDGFMHLSGVFGVCGVKNNNSRIYETKNYAKMVESMKERIKKSPIPGELEHPQTMNITLENISHRIDAIDIDENGVVSGEITLLDTPKGKIAQAIVEGGLPLFISSRATGNVDQRSGVVTLENLQTYDLVGSPGFSQAELHLNENQVAESICESVYYITENDEPEEEVKNEEVAEEEVKNEEENTNENIDNDMEMNEILEKLNDLTEKYNDLKLENEELREQVENTNNFDLKKICDGIQNWIVEEYSPVLQSWICEEFAQDFKNNEVDEAIEDAMDSATENAVEIVSEKFVNDIAPKIQQWVVEEYSPVVEKWCCTELAEGIQNWVIEEYTPETKEAVVAECAANAAQKIAESQETTKQSKKDAISDTLALLESMEVSKPTYVRKGAVLNESIDEPRYIAEMPEDVRVKWNMASQEVKESVNRRAKLYNFANEGAVERFWNNVNLDEVKPVTNVYEGLDKVIDTRERDIRAQLRSWKSRR